MKSLQLMRVVSLRFLHGSDDTPLASEADTVTDLDDDEDVSTLGGVGGRNSKRLSTASYNEASYNEPSFKPARGSRKLIRVRSLTAGKVRCARQTQNDGLCALPRTENTNSVPQNVSATVL